MKKLFGNTVRKLSSSSTSTAFNLRRLSVNSSSSLAAAALTIKVLRGGYNIDLEKVDSSFTKLHKAAYLNNEDRVKKYIANPKYSVNAVDSAGRTALHLAAVNGNERVVKSLIMAGANANLQDIDGKTPMIKAVECAHPEVLHLLMEFGADLDLADKAMGNTVLHHALITAHLDCALYIIRNALIIDYNRRNHVSLSVCVCLRREMAKTLLLSMFTEIMSTCDLSANIKGVKVHRSGQRWQLELCTADMT